MAVPNNYSFSLQTVINEIPGSQDDLAECFSEATDSLFDSNYRGSKNSLRNFRNYNAAPPVTTYAVSLGRNSIEQQACTSPESTYYVSGGANFYQATGLYTNSNGTIKAPAFYYSDGGLIRYWNGNSFSGGEGLCFG
ncbi:MAG: hypothetical protein WBG90_09825 [Saonia sp.]